MNDVKPLSLLVQKRTEGVQKYRLSLTEDDVVAVPDERYKYSAVFSINGNMVKKIDLKIVETSLVQFDSKQIADLPAGVYRLEIWETVSDVIHAIFPSDRSLKFKVIENALDLPHKTVSSLTLDEFERRFDVLAKRFSAGQFENPRFKVGRTVTAEPGQPATVEMITSEDGSVVIVNYAIPKGEKGDTWEPYVAEDGHWHIRLKEDKKHGTSN